MLGGCSSRCWLAAMSLFAVVQIGVLCVLLLAPPLAARLYVLHELLTYPGNRFYDGRTARRHPAPACCFAEGCLESSRRKHAVATSLRSAKYLPLLQGMATSLRHNSPGTSLVILTVAAELDADTMTQAHRLGAILTVDDIAVGSSNTYEDGRFDKNWIKIRLWELDYDALLWVDADTAIAGDLRPAFELPTEFAATLDIARTHRRYSSLGKMQAGVFLMRPCPKIAAHMLQLLAADRRLHFAQDHAEQDFLDWYFKHSRMTLPPEWNFPAHLLLVGPNSSWVTTDGLPPKIVHFTDDKPWRINPSLPGHSFLPHPPPHPPPVARVRNRMYDGRDWQD